jgi:hypothetical protein
MSRETHWSVHAMWNQPRRASSFVERELMRHMPPEADWPPQDDLEAMHREVLRRWHDCVLIRCVAGGARLELLRADHLRPFVAAAWESLNRQWFWHAFLADDRETRARRRVADGVHEMIELLEQALGIEP